MSLFKRRKPPSADGRERAEAYMGLRSQILNADPTELGLAGHPGAWAALMEMGMERGIATLVVVADGTTSLYLSTGGGTIGAGTHASVREQSDAFLTVVARRLDELDASAPGADRFPNEGEVQFIALVGDARLVALFDERTLALGTHPLSEVFMQGHRVITAIRELPV